MEEKVKMSIKNEDGKMITKDIPKNLYSLYVGMGWTKVNNMPPKNTYSNNKEEKKFSIKD